MPRKHHRRSQSVRRARRNPALRIAPRRHEVEGEKKRGEGTDQPLDDLSTVRPSELVPLSTLAGGDEFSTVIVAGTELPARDEPSLEEYIQRIEQSAARLREEQLGETATAGARGRPREGELPRKRSSSRGRGRRVDAARQARERPRQRWYRRRRNWLLVALIIPLLVVGAAAVYVANIVRLSVGAYQEIHQDPVDRIRWQVNPAGTPEPVPSAQVEAVLPSWDSDRSVNILLLGVDAEVEDQPPRSDTAIVVHVNPETNAVAMMSIPRDLIVFIPGFGEDKFNAAYAHGEANADEIPGGGPTLVAQTVEANFNIPIHHFATIDFDGFERIVDTVGGVVVDVDSHISDNQYPTADLRYTRVFFSTGLRKLDGATALQYVRTRHGDSDFGRSQRQQQVLMAIREQAISRDLITQAPQLIRDMQETLRTDLNFNQMLALSNLGRQIGDEDIARLNLWSEGILTEHFPDFDGDAYYVVADWEQMLSLNAAFFSDPRSVAESEGEDLPRNGLDLGLPVFIENATDIPMLAGNSAQILVEAGFETVWPSDAPENQERSIIRTSQSEIETAEHIAELLGLPGSSIVTAVGTDGITVVLGGDVPEHLVPESQRIAG